MAFVQLYGVISKNWQCAAPHKLPDWQKLHSLGLQAVCFFKAPIYILEQVKPGFTTYQPQPKYSWALSQIGGKGKLVKTLKEQL